MVAPKAVKTAQPAAPASAGAPRPALPLEQWPDKKLFRIGELAELLGVETHVVRYWLKEFPQVHTERSDTNRLLFGRAAAEKLWRIRDLLYAQGYTLAGARKALSGGRAGKVAEATPAAAIKPALDADSPAGPSRAEVELASQIEVLQTEVRALQARLSASQASEAAARARAEEQDARAQQEQTRAQQEQTRAQQEQTRAQQQQERADQLAAKLQQEAALAQHFQQALQAQQAQQAQQTQQVRAEREHQERERWSDFAAVLGDLAAEIRG